MRVSALLISEHPWHHAPSSMGWSCDQSRAAQKTSFLLGTIGADDGD